MKKALGTVLAAGFLAATLSGCAYGKAVASGADKVVILRQDSFLFGALRKAFVCKVTDGGLASCNSNEAP